jgi:hypothetical protein
MFWGVLASICLAGPALAKGPKGRPGGPGFRKGGHPGVHRHYSRRGYFKTHRHDFAPGIFWGGYGGGLSSLYHTGHIPVPPYFALHPPVYYSYPIARTYGYSPYAYPFWTKTPEIEPPRPVIFQNGHIRGSTTCCPQSDRVVSKPLRITNPYVAQTAEAKAGKKPETSSRPGPQPKSVFPAMLAERE